jgi:hypothetical protein
LTWPLALRRVTSLMTVRGWAASWIPSCRDAELAVFDDDDDDLPAVDVAEVDLYSGDHHGALAGDHAGHVQGLGGWCGSGPGEACPVQPAAGGGWQRAGQGAGQDAAGGDDVDELGVDAQGDALPGEVDSGADLLAADADESARIDQTPDFDDGAGGQRPGRQGGGRGWPGGVAVGRAQPGEVFVVQGDRVGLDQLPVAEDVQGGTVEAEGDLLPGQRLAEPDLPPGGEHVPAGRDDPVDLHRVGVAGRGRGRRGAGRLAGCGGEHGW